MTTKRTLAIVLLIPFAALSLYAVAEVGYIGIFDYHRHSPAGWQVFTDLVIALILVLSWMVPEIRRAGKSPWPWIALTIFLGSIGPLVYLATRPRRNANTG